MLSQPSFLNRLLFQSPILSPSDTQRIQSAVSAVEMSTSAEVFVAVEKRLPILASLSGLTTRERALQVFTERKVWDTEANSGVLLYICLARRSCEIVADRGVNRVVGESRWREITSEMIQTIKESTVVAGIIRAIEAIGGELKTHFPDDGSERNELPNAPVCL